MMDPGIRRASAISWFLVLVVVIAFAVNLNSASAQSPNTDQLPCCQDMWSPSWMQRDMWGPGHMGRGMRQRMTRHWTFMHQGIPIAYVGAKNPLSTDADTVREGRALYTKNCTSCHGMTGMGDGEAANSLTPSPALLAFMIQTPMAVDEYMLWSISEGGAAFGTAMPAFKEKLTEDEIWKIVTFMRAGFPDSQAQR